MKHINSIEKYKGKTYCLTLDETEENTHLHLDIISEYHLKADMNIPDEAWDEIVHANRLRTAKERAMYLLDYKDYSYTEMFRKLEQNYPEDICFEVMERLVELGLINDRRYAKMFARRLVEVKHFGFYRCTQEMRLKGIDRELIDEALSEYSDTVHERLVELIQDKYARKMTDKASVVKVKNALVRMGYSYSEVNAAIDEFELDDDE